MKMGKYYGEALILACVLFCGLMPAQVFAENESDVYLVLENYTWKEFSGGTRLLKEAGPLFGVGFAYQFKFRDEVTLKPGVEIFVGSVDYDGAPNAGGLFKTTTDYFGLKLQAEVGRRFALGKAFSIEPIAGIGLRAWMRDINDGRAEDGSPADGHNEEWVTLHLRLGVRGGLDLSNASALFAEVGLKVPLYNESTRYVANGGLDDQVTMHPGKMVSLFAETGLKLRTFRISVFYDGLRFSESDVEYNSSVGYYQHESRADIYGIKAASTF